MPVTGTKIVANNIVRYTKGFLRETNRVMKEVEFILDKKITDNMSLTDHSLQDLKSLGHPYSRRSGAAPLHDPSYQVHKQSGKLLRSKRSGTEEASVVSGKLTASAFVMLDETKAPHANHVIFGTSKMIPRPVLEGSRDEVVEPALTLIQTKLRNLTVTFR